MRKILCDDYYVLVSLKTLSHWLLRTFMWNGIFISFYRWNAEILSKLVQGQPAISITHFAFMFLMPLSPFYLALWFLQMFGRIRPFPVSQLLEKWPRISLLVCNIREEALFFNWKQEEPKTNLNIIKTWKFSYFHWSVVYTWGNFGSLSSYLWILKCA